MGTEELVAMISAMFGRRVTVAQAGEILRATFPLTVRPGSVVCREGEEAAGLLIFLSGTAEVVKQSRDGTERVIATVDAPTVLGEMSLLTQRRHSATVRATTDCELRLFRRQDLARLLESESVMAYKVVATIAEVLARRLWLMDEKVLELAAERDRSGPVEELTSFRNRLFSDWSF
jgi:CRP-like cAMP-binding protein